MKKFCVGTLHTLRQTDAHPPSSSTLHRSSSTPCLYPGASPINGEEDSSVEEDFKLLVRDDAAVTTESTALEGGRDLSSTGRSSGASITRAGPTSHGRIIGVTAAACLATNHDGNSAMNSPKNPGNHRGRRLRRTRSPRACAAAGVRALDTRRTHARMVAS